eukprot:4624733-Prymnesium_polylepis.1
MLSRAGLRGGAAALALPRAHAPALAVAMEQQQRGLAVKTGFKKKKNEPQQQRGTKKSGEGRDPYSVFKQAILSEPDDALRKDLPDESWSDRQDRKRRYSQNMMAEVRRSASPVRRHSSPTHLRVPGAFAAYAGPRAPDEVYPTARGGAPRTFSS